MERIVIVGAGAMGCLFAAKLALAGRKVVLVDVDRARLQAIADHGLRLNDDTGERTISVSTATAPEVQGSADLVLIFTKAMHTQAAVRSISHVAADRCHALTLQNGLGNGEAIAQVFGPAHTLVGVTDWPADLAGLNRVDNHGRGHVWLGPQAGDDGAASRAVANMLSAAGLSAEYDPHIHAAIWEKAAFNAALNALATILRQPVGALDCQQGRRIATAVADETLAVAAARGIAMDRARLLAKIDFALIHHKAHKPSMLQDRMAGRATEIDAINGQIVRAATAAGLAAPVTAALADLVQMGEVQPAHSTAGTNQA